MPSRRCGGIFDVANRRNTLAELEAEAASPTFWNDQIKAKEKIAKTNALKALVGPYDKLAKRIEETGLLIELAEGETDPGQQAVVVREIEDHFKQAEIDQADLQMRALLSGKFDANNAYLSLHAGAGGTESCDWNEMLYRMYRRYCEKHGFEMSVLDYLAGEEAGIKSVTFQVTGPYAYGYLKA